MPEIVLTRDIEAGEFFTYAAPRAGDRILIIGNIGAGADVTVTGGEFELRGSVGANSRVTFIDPATKGKKGAFNATSAPRDGLIIDGAVGENVVLASDTGIRVRGDIAGRLLADAAGDFRAKNVGDHANIRAGRDVAMTGVGAASQVRAGARAEIIFVGASSRVQARQIIGGNPTQLPYRCPRNSHDVRVGARATVFYNGSQLARLKKW